MSLGSLQTVLFTSRLSLNFPKRISILKEIALGMNYLHSLKPPFIHRDLKSGNVLLDENLTVKVSDFGLSSIKHLDEHGDEIQGPVGSPYYMAPEILLDKPYDTKADVYSFSIVMWETLTNEDPYQGEFNSYDEMLEGITFDGIRPRIPEWFPVGVTALITKCWNADPSQRPSFAEILQSNWFDHILLDYMISDPMGRDFWKSCFLDKLQVGVDEFLQALCRYCSVPYREQADSIRLLKSLISTQTSTGIALVTLESWNSVLNWYGPYSQPMDFGNH
jgi:serine/threonine protein kinase